MKFAKVICLMLCLIVIIGCAIGVTGVNADATMTPFAASDVRWVIAENWRVDSHPQATFARQSDGNWYAVNSGYELDFQLHPHSATAVDALVQAVIDLQVISGPSAITPPDLDIQSTEYSYTPPDFGVELLTSNGDYRFIWVYPLKSGNIASVWDSIGHFNYYTVGDDSAVMAALTGIAAASGT